MFLISEGDVTILWEGFLCWRAMVKYWKLISERWSWTGSILVSSCRWSVELISPPPVVMRRAEILNILEFLNKGWWGDGEPNGSCIHEKGSDTGHICNKYGFLLLTPVGTRKGLEDVDTGWSQARMIIDFTWALNLKWGLKVTLNIRGVLTRGSKEFFRVTRGWVLGCTNWGLKRVNVDFVAEMTKPRSSDEWAVTASANVDQRWSWNRKLWSHLYRSWWESCRIGAMWRQRNWIG